MLSDSQDPGPGHGLNVMGPVIMTHPLKLETKVIRRFPKISQSPPSSSLLVESGH